MRIEEMKALYEAHVAAVNAHDVDRVMATFHKDCYVEDLAFGLRIEGADRVSQYYERLFSMFRDAEMTVDGWAFGDDVVVAWGSQRVTVPGLFLEFGSSALPVEITSTVALVTIKDGLVAGERIFLNLASICDEAGVSIDRVRGAVRTLMA